MTEKEKAHELAMKFCNSTDVIRPNIASIKKALIATKEIIEQWEYIDTYLADMNGELNPNLKYWYNVKKELNTFGSEE